MRASIFCLVLLGCVDDPATVEVVEHRRHHIEVSTEEPPTLIAYRLEGDAVWRTPTRKDATTYTFEARGPYRVTVVCESLERAEVYVQQLARTPADGRRFTVPCETTPNPYRVSGTMLQPGTVAIGHNADRSPTAPWTFDLGADGGKQALVAATDDHAAVRRFKVRGDVTLSPIDVVAEGAPLVPFTPVVTNLTGAETNVYSIVFPRIEDTLLLLHAGDLAETKLIPNRLLRGRETHTVTIAAHDPDIGRTVTRQVREGDSPVFALPVEVNGPVVFDDFSVAWSTLAPYDTLALEYDAFSFETFVFVIYRQELTRAFVEATGITSTTFETDTIPGFDPLWLMDLAQEYHRFFGGERELPNGDIVGSDVAEVISPW